jgi:1-aminocyclopropane-1-carboxylate deaminase/D-cysteine desulfhydrase-like pyridoxal-dependent ACC family enzyme
MTLAYPRRNELARTPTPLQYLERASQNWGRGHRLWVKRDDLTGCTLSGNKVRKLEFITAYAQDNGYDTLITCGGLQSNHCRATAFAGARLGLQVHLLLRGERPADADGNLLLDETKSTSCSTIGSNTMQSVAGRPWPFPPAAVMASGSGVISAPVKNCRTTSPPPVSSRRISLPPPVPAAPRRA